MDLNGYKMLLAVSPNKLNLSMFTINQLIALRKEVSDMSIISGAFAKHLASKTVASVAVGAAGGYIKSKGNAYLLKKNGVNVDNKNITKKSMALGAAAGLGINSLRALNDFTIKKERILKRIDKEINKKKEALLASSKESYKISLPNGITVESY